MIGSGQGFQAQHLLEACFRLIKFSERIEHVAQLEVCLGRIRFDPNGLSQAVDGLGMFSQGPERSTKPAVRHGHLRLKRDGLPKAVGGIRELSELAVDHAQHVVRLGVCFVSPAQFGIEIPGLGQAVTLEQGERLLLCLNAGGSVTFDH